MEEAAARTLGCAPPAKARLHMMLLVGVDGPAVKLAVFFHSRVVPSAKKWAKSAGRSGSAPVKVQNVKVQIP